MPLVWILWFFAQEPAQDSSTVHEEIVVTAARGPEERGRAPASVSILTRAEISRMPAESLAELLPRLPGFYSYFGSEFGGPPPMTTARGFFGGGEAEYVQLRVDGVAVSDVESGVADWRAIRASEIERVEALRGPGAYAWGDTALAGVIQVFTRSDTEGSGFSAGVSGGSFGYAAADLSLAVAASDASSIAAVAEFSRTDGDREHSAATQGGARLSATRPLGTGALSVALSGLVRERDDPGPLPLEQIAVDPSRSDPLFRFDRERISRAAGSLTWQNEVSSTPLRAALHAAWKDAENLRTLLLAPGVGDRTRRDTRTLAAGVLVEARRSLPLPSGAGAARAGAEFDFETMQTSYRPVDDGGTVGPIVAETEPRRGRQAVFVSADVPLSSRLTAAAGLRWDRIADDAPALETVASADEAWSPRLGLSLALDPAARSAVFVQYSRAFKTPTLDQRFDPHPFPDFQGGTFSISNALLRPQRAETLEGGLHGAGARSRFAVSAYRITVRDEIDFDPATFRYANIGTSRHWGVEAEGQWRASASLFPFVSYAWTRAVPRAGDNAGRQLKNIPTHLLRLGVSAGPVAGVEAQAIATLVAGRFADDAERAPLADAWTLDMRLARQLGPGRLHLDLTNLANTRFEAVGFVLPDFSGGAAAFAYPGNRLAVRVGYDWTP
jgi:outer membrane receptor protein involved in Fe transport